MISPEERAECTWVQEVLFESGDNSLDEIAQEKLRRHLAECPRCTAVQGWDDEFSRVLSSSDRPHSVSLKSEVHRQLRLRSFRRAAGAASILLLIGAVVWMSSGRFGNEPIPDVVAKKKLPRNKAQEPPGTLTVLRETPIVHLQVVTRDQDVMGDLLEELAKEKRQ